MTELNLGVTYEYVQEKRVLAEKRREMEEEVYAKEVNVAYLQNRERRTPSEQRQLDELKMSVPVLKMQLNKIYHQLKVLSRRQSINEACVLHAAVVHPPVSLMMGIVDAPLGRMYRKADFCLKEGHIVATELGKSQPEPVAAFFAEEDDGGE